MHSFRYCFSYCAYSGIRVAQDLPSLRVLSFSFSSAIFSSLVHLPIVGQTITVSLDIHHFFFPRVNLVARFFLMRYYIYIIISFSLVFALIIHHQSNLKTLFEKYQGSKEINCQVNFLCGQVFLFSRSRSPVTDRILLISRKVISSQQQFFISDHVHITCMNRI